MGSTLPFEPAPSAAKNAGRTRSTLRLVLAALVFMALAIAALGGKAYFDREHFSPRAVVEKYAAALVEGRARDALELFDPYADGEDRALLSNEVYRAALRPGSIRVTGVEQSGTAARVSVRVEQNGHAYDVDLELARGGKTALIFNNWHITSGFQGYIELGETAGARRVGGVVVDLETDTKPARLAALPGGYEFTPSEDEQYTSWQGENSAEILPATSAAPARARIDFQRVPNQAAAQRAIELAQEKVQACVESGEQELAGICPAAMDVTPIGNVRNLHRSWSEKPEFSAELSGNGGNVQISGGTMKADYDFRFFPFEDWSADSWTSSSVFGAGTGATQIRFTVRDGQVRLGD